MPTSDANRDAPRRWGTESALSDDDEARRRLVAATTRCRSGRGSLRITVEDLGTDHQGAGDRSAGAAIGGGGVGSGTGPLPAGGQGIRGMRERLLLINGSLTAAAGVGRWTVTARVPR